MALLAALGAAWGKAEAEAPEANAAAQAPVVGISEGIAKAAMVDAGLTNLSGITPDGELPSGSPPPHVPKRVGWWRP